jgi:hypothetical protein
LLPGCVRSSVVGDRDRVYLDQVPGTG